MNNKVVVIGGSHHNTLGVVRSLGMAGIKDILLIVVGSSPDFVSCTKYVDKKNRIKVENDGALLETMHILGPCFNNKPVVICSSDTSIALLDKHYDALKKFYILPNAKGIESEINKLMDKSVQCDIARKIGFEIPLTVESSQKDLLNQWNVFPCIVKPEESILGSKADIKICTSKEELDSVLSLYQGRPFQVQKYIKKEMEFQLIGCSVDSGKKLILPGYTRIIRQPKNTNTGFLEYINIDLFNDHSFLNKVKKYMENIGYEGLFSLEFLRDENGVNYFLEINMRNDGNSFCVMGAGVNLPYNWFLYKTQGCFTNEKIKKNTFFMPEIEDLKMCVKGKYNLLLWLKQFAKSTHAVYNIKDPYPFVKKFGFNLKTFVKNLPKKFYVR